MTGVVRWVVVDAGSLDLHIEAVAFLASLRARGCSPNTERVYAGRVALYLSYCRMRRLDWRAPGFLDLAGLQQWLVETPVQHRVPNPLGVAPLKGLAELGLWQNDRERYGCSSVECRRWLRPPYPAGLRW